MNPYQFVRSSRFVTEDKVVSADAMKNAAIVDDIDAILASSEVAGKYEFVADEALTKKVRENTTEMARLIDLLADGVTEVNRIAAVYKGRACRWRVYGTDKVALPEKTYTADEIKKAEFGFCKSNGEFVTEMKVGASGVPQRMKVIYLNCK
jgi:hypothetical protein